MKTNKEYLIYTSDPYDFNEDERRSPKGDLLMKTSGKSGMTSVTRLLKT